MPSPILDSSEPDLASDELASAREILARLERYAATQRTAADPTPVAPPPVAPTSVETSPVAPRPPVDRFPVEASPAHTAPIHTAPIHTAPVDAALAYPATSLDVLPSRVHRGRINPATADLFPYDLAASIVGCAATILAYISLGLPIALFITGALVVGGESARRKRWFPSLGVNLIIGTIIGLIVVFTA